MFEDSVTRFGAERFVRRGFDVANIFMWVFFALIVVLVECRGYMVDKQVAIHALETQGYTNVLVNEKHYILVGLQGCDQKDAAKFDAEATNPIGQRVNLFVCTGWLFKGATIRTSS